MKIRVPNRSVRNNIETFSFLLQKERKPELQSKKKRSSFGGRINRDNGEIVFQDLVPNQEDVSGSNWKPICLRVRPEDSDGHKTKFEVVESEEKQEAFKYDDLGGNAKENLSATVTALNELSEQTSEKLDVDTFLDQLLSFQLEEGEEIVDTDILHAAWHEVSRWKAEDLLENKIPGTFFFRKDEFADLLERGLGIPCITLSYLNRNKRVVDITLVQYGESWVIYDDDPALRCPMHKSLLALIVSLGGELTLPLFR